MTHSQILLRKKNDLSPGKLGTYVGNTHSLLEAFDTFKDAVYIIDVHSLKPVYMNRSLLQILGYDAQQIAQLGEKWAKTVTHPDDLELIIKHLQEFAKMKGSESLRITFRMKDALDKWRLFESTDIPFSYNEKLQVQQVMGITRDVTESFRFFDPYAHRHKYADYEHRCRTCKKLLGKENLNTAMIYVKCSRCGDMSAFTRSV